MTKTSKPTVDGILLDDSQPELEELKRLQQKARKKKKKPRK